MARKKPIERVMFVAEMMAHWSRAVMAATGPEAVKGADARYQRAKRNLRRLVLKLLREARRGN